MKAAMGAADPTKGRHHDDRPRNPARVLDAEDDRQGRVEAGDEEEGDEAAEQPALREIEIAAGLAVADQQADHAPAGGHQLFEKCRLLRHENSQAEGTRRSSM